MEKKERDWSRGDRKGGRTRGDGILPRPSLKGDGEDDERLHEHKRDEESVDGAEERNKR